MSVSHDDGFFSAHDGLRLYYRRWTGTSGAPALSGAGAGAPPSAGADPSTAIIATVHGYLEHSGRYGFVGDYFAPRGFTVYGFDHRGHGQSGGTRAHVARFGDYLTDVDRYLDLIRDREGSQKNIFLVGHSMGGLVSLRYALERPERLRAIAVSSPYLGNKVNVSGAKLFAGKILSRLFPTAALDAGLDRNDLSHDAAVIAAHAADPLVLQKFTARWATEAMAAQDWCLANAHRMALPSLVMQASDDRLADPAVSRTFFERITHPDKTFKSYTGYYHELFNEVGRAEVFRDLETWLRARL